MEYIDKLLEKLPFSRSMLVVLVILLLVAYELSQPPTEDLDSWENSMAQREDSVRQSLENLQIPDQGLLGCIRSAVADRARIPPTSSGGIDDVRELQMLYCRDAGIKSLAGIGELTSLYFLDLSKNRIQSLSPLQDHPRLRSLYLTDNPLESIEAVASLPALQEVYLPDFTDRPCLDLKAVVKNLKSNYDSIRCTGPRREAVAASILDTGSLPADTATEDDFGSTELTAAQQREILDYERDMRFRKK